MSDELNISAAVQRFEVSRKTVRRRLAEGAIDGASQVPGDHGPEWVFPAASLEALGYRLRSADDPEGGGDDTGDGLPFAAAEDADAPPTRRGRELVVLVAVLIGLLLGFLGATFVRSDDASADPLAAVLDELTGPGDEIGVIGAPADAELPAGRVPVPLDDLADAPRYVVIGDGDPAVLETLLADARPVLTLDRPTGAIWLFDTGGDPLPASSTSEAPATTTSVVAAGPSVTAPTTTTPTVTAPPATTTTTVDPGPAVDPEPSEGDPTDPAGDPSVDPAAGTVMVAAGDSFWTIAEGVVADSLGTTPTDAQITGYWAALVDANVDSLVEAGNPDLILPGQVFQLPPI